MVLPGADAVELHLQVASGGYHQREGGEMAHLPILELESPTLKKLRRLAALTTVITI